MSDTPELTMKDAVINQSNTIRGELLELEQVLRDFKQFAAQNNIKESGFDNGEVIANITLAYRHLEDARMRLGKVIQAADGGVSIYDKK